MLVRRLSGDRLSVTVATTPLSQRSTVMYFVCEFGVLLVELEKWPLWNEVALGLDYWLMSWPVTAYFSIYDHWKLQQARHFRARSEWLNMTKVGGRNESLSKSLTISQHAMQSWRWKLRQGQDALEQKAVSRPGKRKRTKACTSKLRKGLNITVNVGVWFCNDDFCKRKPEGKKRDFFRFSMMLEMVFFVLVQIKKKITKKLIFFRVYWVSQFGAHSTQCSQLTVKAMFARLRKLQCFNYKATL